NAACDRVSGCVRRMAMDDGLRLWHCLIDFKVQEDLTGAGRAAGELVTVEVHQRHIRSLQISLADQGWSAENGAVGEAVGDVSPIAVHILPLPEFLADC